jgi:hypothetical protein
VKYPATLGEFETLELVLNGASLSRYGDGELKMADREAGIKSQDYHPVLRKRLREILHDSGECLVGIPNIRGVLSAQVSDQKVQHWSKYLELHRLLGKRAYASAFVTRPDSAPWIDTAAYWARLSELWIGQEVTLVRGSGKSLTGERLMEWGAGTVTEVVAPRQQAWAEYASLLDRIGTPSRALLCLGPTATVMAVDLCDRGVHAVDLGHVGMFLRKHHAGEPMWVSDADKVAV